MASEMTTFLDAKSVRRFSDRRARSNRHGTVGFGPPRARIRSSPRQKRRPEGSNSFDRGGQASVTRVTFRYAARCLGDTAPNGCSVVTGEDARCWFLLAGADLFSPKCYGSEKPRKH